MTKNQTFVLGGIILIVVVVLVVRAFSSSEEGEAQTQQQASSPVVAAWENLRNSKSVHMITNLDLSLPNASAQAANQPVVDIAIATEGDSIWREKPTYAGKFTITTKGRGMQLFTDGDIYILPDSTTFKLQNLPTLLNPSGNLLGKWTSTQASLLRATNPEALPPTFTTLFSNWEEKETASNVIRYEKTFTEDEEKQLESVFKFESSGSSALHILARLLKNFNINKAEAWINGNEMKELKFHFAKIDNKDQQATLRFAFSEQGKDVTIEVPKTESTVQPEIFTQLFGEPKPAITPTPKPTPRKR